MRMAQGKKIPLSLGRKLVLEFLHHCKKIPTVPVSKKMQLGELVRLRRAGADVSWVAIFMRAYALTAQQHAVLRRVYIRWPLAHIYEHSCSNCAVLMEREYGGDKVLVVPRVRQPEAKSLQTLDDKLAFFRQAPFAEVNHFRLWLRLARVPWWLRRLAFWLSLNFSGRKRAKRLGTFAISSQGQLGAEQEHPISPWPTFLTFGPIAASGEVTVRIIYDHRITDGREIARCLGTLEQVLNGQIGDELQALLAQPPKEAA